MLYYKQNLPQKRILGIWLIEENKEELISLLENKSWYQEIISIKSEPRSVEKLAIRVLMKEIIGKELFLRYDEGGKPYINEDIHISVSHTKGFAAVLVGENCQIGIDIEYISDRIKRIKSKFITAHEYINSEKEVIHLLIHWCAKEAVYKAYYKQINDLMNDVIIQKFEPENSGHIYAILKGKNELIKIYYSVEDLFVLAYC